MSRRKGRYERRRFKRGRNKELRGEAVGGLADIFTFHDMFKLGRVCCNGVRWKQSTQNFERHLFSGTAARRRQILAGKYKQKGYSRFTLCERGKTRTIDAPHVQDRQIQKVLTRKVLLPCYEPLLIYNNGASMKGKGLDFARRELEKDLRSHFKRYGLRGWVIVADFKGFFPNASHAHIKAMHESIRIDSRVRAMLDSLFSAFTQGVPLGVEPSQIEMVAYPSKLDNYVTCQLGLKAGHYMDDYYILIPPDRDPKEVLKQFKTKAHENALTLNESKTHIIKFGRPFRFCKFKYAITKTGRVAVHAGRDAISRALRKLKRLKGKVKLTDIWAIVQSCHNYYSRSSDHGRILKLRRKFFKLYGFSCERYENFKERRD